MPKFCTSFLALALFAGLPLLALAQTAGNTAAPLGSKSNPIKPTIVGTPTGNSGKSAKGKRGSKTNPIAGSVHPRTSN